VVLAAAVVVLVAVVVVLLMGGRGAASSPQGDDTAMTQEDKDLAALRAEFADRDRTQVEALTATAREASTALNELMTELGTYLPPGAEPATETASPGAVAEWAETIDAVDAAFGDPPSGETATNVARGSLDASVDTLRIAVKAYGDALRLPPGEDRLAALHRAAESRDLGVRIWSLGATQLDYVNVELGLGHQHVHLAVTGVEGAMTADPEPEGGHDH
jgi:FlaG/FlaF family flagellin (archaellin)